MESAADITRFGYILELLKRDKTHPDDFPAYLQRLPSQPILCAYLSLLSSPPHPLLKVLEEPLEQVAQGCLTKPNWSSAPHVQEGYSKACQNMCIVRDICTKPQATLVERLRKDNLEFSIK